MIDLVAPADRERTLAAAAAHHGRRPAAVFREPLCPQGRRAGHHHVDRALVGKDQLRIAVARDVTARRQAESMQVALYAISEATHAAKGLPDLCERIHRIVDGLLPARNFSVGPHDAGGLSFPYRLEKTRRSRGSLPPPRRPSTPTCCGPASRCC